MTALVLHLGNQYGLTLERWRPENPVALGQHANDLAMGMLANLADKRLTIGLGHKVLGLYAAIGVYLGLKCRVADRIVGRRCANGFQGGGVCGK